MGDDGAAWCLSLLTVVMHLPVLHPGMTAKCVVKPDLQFYELSMSVELKHTSDGCTCLSVWTCLCKRKRLRKISKEAPLFRML